jgi:Rrf2 family protein
MKPTTAVRCALQVLVHLAALDASAQATAHAFARAHGLSGAFLLKALLPLARAGVLKSLRGPNGGYRLARPATQITLLEIVEAVDGPIRGLVPAVGCVPAAAAGLNRRLAEVCDAAADAARKELRKVRLSDLTGPSTR